MKPQKLIASLLLIGALFAGAAHADDEPYTDGIGGPGRTQDGAPHVTSDFFHRGGGRLDPPNPQEVITCPDGTVYKGGGCITV